MTSQRPGWRARRFSRRIARRLGGCGSGVEIGRPATIKNPASVVLGDAVVVREHAWLNCESAAGPTLTIGHGSYIGRFAHINAARSVVLEDEVLVADRVHISDYQHSFADPTRSVVTQGSTEPRPVRIGAGSWIGVGAVIMPGVSVGRGAIVGANAVVTHDVGEFEIVGGVPAVVIGNRRP
jgi:acetyltransferase-like isoleucine patch superfamily enzyme